MRTSILSRYLLSGVLLMAAGAGTGAAPANTIPKRINAATKELLVKIGEAGQNGFTVDDTTAEAKTLLKAGWLLVNETTRSGNNIAVALSPSGTEKYKSYLPAETSRGPQMKPEDFEIEKDVPMPDFGAQRRVARQVYPFDKLTEVGMSFFIPAPDDLPEDKDFAATRTGTVGAQNRKNKEAWEALPAEGRPEKPVAFKVTNDTKNGKRGARVFRVS